MLLTQRTLSQSELKGELSLAATNKQACREMLLLHAGILGHAFVSYFFTRLKTLNILLIQALLTYTVGRLPAARHGFAYQNQRHKEQSGHIQSIYRKASNHKKRLKKARKYNFLWEDQVVLFPFKCLH